jgi:hypothetical protein
LAVDASVWTVELKSWWRDSDGRRCDLLTIRNAQSCAVLAVRVVDCSNSDAVRSAFEALCERLGWPNEIQTNAGLPEVALKHAERRIEIRWTTQPASP